MRWSEVNSFLPLHEPREFSTVNLDQSANIRRGLSNVWGTIKLEYMMNRSTYISVEADKTYKQWKSEDKLPGLSNYFFRFPLKSKTDPETLRRVMIVLK